MNEINYHSDIYRRSRNAYTAQAAFEYFVAILVGDAFLAKLLSNIGVSDALIGIISSFISLAFIVQIMSIFMLSAVKSKKKIVIALDTVSNIFFCGIYFLPLVNLPTQTKTFLVIGAILIAYISKYLISTISFQWANSYVDPTRRGSYSAVKEIISLASGIVFSTVIGLIIDKYESIGNINGGFLFIAITMLVLNVCNFVSYSLIKDSIYEEKEKASFRDVIKHTFGNKKYRRVLKFGILWDCAKYFTIGFLGIYKTKDLMISVFAVQVINIAASFARMVVSRPFGKYSDRHTYAKGLELAMIIAAASFFVNIFTTRETWFFVVIHTVLYNVSLAGINHNSLNIVYSYVDSKYIMQATAFKNCIGGMFGFGASLAAGKLVSTVQANGNVIMGMHINAQQITSAISFVLTVILVVYLKLVITKQKVKIQ